MAVKHRGNKNGKSLVVVESPAKARTLGRILGDGYILKASQGHVRDLPANELAINVKEGFVPDYSVLDSRRGIIDELKRTGKGAAAIYLATDPDREGEAISWHIAEETGWDKAGDLLNRVVFHEITQEAVLAAFQHPRSLDMKLVNAQQTRRILDRLVGYQISPLLWSKVQRGLSAGRVQSVALRLVVDREREIEGFVPTESWSIEAQLRRTAALGKGEEPFGTVLQSLRGQRGKVSLGDESSAQQIWGELQGASYTVAQVRMREAKQAPSAPFITSTLQQEAYRKLRFSTKKTMSLAQQLYEGVQLGNEGPVGLITYMRTDSTNVASSAIAEVRQYILATYGQEYLIPKPREFRKKVKGAQEAHEAIRPTSIQREPDSLRSHLSADQRRLYGLIWSRMLASQMPDALSDTTTADIDATCKGASKTYVFRATGSVMRFPGFRAVYLEGRDDSEEEEGKSALPELTAGMALDCQKLEAKQHFTQPPPRFSEATLVKAMEERGIGRPSTYAPIISTIGDRNYVARDGGRLSPTPLGTTVCDLLTQFFPDVMDVSFTARMEEGLDEVARGERQWVPMLQEFYGPFEQSLKRASQEMPKVRVEEPTDEVCDECGKPMVIKTGRFGRFMACSGFPECRTRRPLEAKAPDEPTEEVCDKCGRPMVIKAGRSGCFLACTGFPDCRSTRPLTGETPDKPTDEVCEKCGQPMAVKAGRYGSFLACTGFPKCRNTRKMAGQAASEPTDEVCEKCGQPMAIKKGRYGRFLGCTGYPKCRNMRLLPKNAPEKEPVAAEV